MIDTLSSFILVLFVQALPAPRKGQQLKDLYGFVTRSDFIIEKRARNFKADIMLIQAPSERMNA